MAKARQGSSLGDWEATLRLLPGYDPFRAPGGAWFVAACADRACAFIEECVRHVEGALAGQTFRLEPWQKALVGNLFGWVREDAHGRVVRRYRECFGYVPRKNGKTPLVAAIALYVFFADGEAGQQDYVAAADREQAGLLFRQAKGMVEQEPELASRCRIYGGNASAGQSRSIVREADGSFLRVVSADADTKHGGNSHLVVIDELHAQPSRDLVDVLTTSMASANRKQPLLICITTADYDRDSICNEKHAYASRVRDGLIDDPHFLPVVYEAGRDEDWTDPKVWAKANPNLGVSVSLEYLDRECKRAKESPAYENTFRRLHLNQKTESASRWIALERWDACGGVVAAESLLGRECFAGLDLASTTDLASLVLAFPDGAGGYDILPFFWCPEEAERKRERTNKARLGEWVRRGWIDATPGDVIDYDRIRARVNELATRYLIREIAIDRWNATHLATQLQGDGFQVVAFGQGYASMSAPTKELEKLVLAGKIRHGGHPVLRWNAGNVVVAQDAAGNLKPDKERSGEKIDGIVALVMALGRAMLAPAPIPATIEVW